MPNRIIKESLCSSEKISLLSDFEFRLWVGLITQADDAGRGDARPALIKGHVFPFRDRITIKDIDAALHGLADKGCVGLYTVDGKPYFYFPSWTKHQRIRDCKPKYPEPTENDDLPQSAASCGELRPESNPIQSESEYKSESNPSMFDAFWDAYPRKVGKKKAQIAFKKVTVELGVLLSAIEQQKKSAQWTKDDGQFIPHPTTWLNGNGWEDKLPEAKTKGYTPAAEYKPPGDSTTKEDVERMKRMLERMEK